MADKVAKTSELRSKGDNELTELVTATKNKLFEARFQNHTNRLNDTASIGKARRELARLYTIQGERRRSAQAAAAKKGGEG